MKRRKYWREFFFFFFFSFRPGYAKCETSTEVGQNEGHAIPLNLRGPWVVRGEKKRRKVFSNGFPGMRDVRSSWELQAGSPRQQDKQREENSEPDVSSLGSCSSVSYQCRVYQSWSVLFFDYLLVTEKSALTLSSGKRRFRVFFFVYLVLCHGESRKKHEKFGSSYYRKVYSCSC
jgi:hypothetical protein